MILYDLSYNYRNYVLTLSHDNPKINVILIACPHWRQKLPKTATNCSRSYSRRKRQQKLPETETNCRQKRQQMLPETATFVAVFGNICCRFWRQYVAVFGNFCRQCGQALRRLVNRAPSSSTCDEERRRQQHENRFIDGFRVSD